MKKLRVFILISILLILWTTIVFAIYKNEITVTYTTTTGELICDVEIDKQDSYKVNGIPYFLVKVRNYNEETLTAVDFEYSLTIKNKTESNGLFVWKTEDGGTGSNTYLSQITTSAFTFGKEREEAIFKVFVRALDETQPVNIEIEINAVQKDMK